MTPNAAPEWQFLPWQREQAQPWLAERERFSHAWLLHGMAGIGKLRFAQAAAASLLCEAPQAHLACGACAACHWLRQGNHPDFRALRPDAIAATEGAWSDAEEAATPAGAKKTLSREIRVEQIRALEAWVNTATHRGGLRIILLYPAQALNAISANALLKLLEEPPQGTVFLLVADNLDRLLPTLVSRCRRLPMAPPCADTAAQWLATAGVADPVAYLAAAGGAPLAALAAAASGQTVSPEWLQHWLQACVSRQGTSRLGRLVDELEKTPPTIWLDTLQRALTDLMLLQAGAALRYYPALASPLGELARRLAPLAVTETARWLAGQQRVAGHPLNPRLFTHAVLLRVTAACA